MYTYTYTYLLPPENVNRQLPPSPSLKFRVVVGLSQKRKVLSRESANDTSIGYWGVEAVEGCNVDNSCMSKLPRIFSASLSFSLSLSLSQ